jgi:hypothetical protein
MNTPRAYFSACSSHNFAYIYVMGGCTYSKSGKPEPVNQVERYDMMRDTWEQLAPMNAKRYMHAACIANM